MPARVSRSSVSQKTAQNARSKKSQKRSLDAFSIASHSAPEKSKIRRHRLGEAVSDGSSSKRRRVQNDDDDDEDDDEGDHASKRRRPASGNDSMDEGSDSDGNEWRMGGPIGDDSDESLDSDEAFGESDEEKFEGFTFRGSSSTKPGATRKANKKTKAKQASTREMDLEEESEADDDDDESDSDFGDQGVDLATMLDYNSEDEEEEEKKKPKKKAAKSKLATLNEDDEDEDEDMFDEEDDDEDDEDSDDDDDQDSDDSDSAPSEADSDGADPDKLSKLQDLIASLDNDPPEKRAARTADVHETQQPSAFGLSATQKLKISDLLPTVTDPALRKSLKLLASDKTSKRSAIPGKLDAPLPKRQQDRLDRTAATQVAKQTLDRWRDTVVNNRRAEFLQFPLKDPNASAPLGQNSMISVQQEKPQNDLESAIQNILVESGLSTKGGKSGEEEKELQEFEELKTNKIPIEEVMARRADLRKARELLFREEAKAKRIKKIKSKAYRRVHRKERERAEAKDQEFRDAEGIEDDEDEKERRDRQRAEDRMGTKHRDSKWAKGMKKAGRTVWDDDARDSMIELARRNEHLRMRMEGKEVHSGDDSDFSDDIEEDDDDDDMEDEAAGRRRLAKKLDSLEEEPKERSKLGDMLFMKRAEAGKKAQNDEEIERMRKELADEDSANEEDEDTTVGRRSFGPKAKDGAPLKPKPVRAELEENPASDEEDRAVDDEVDIIVDQPAANAAKPTRKPKSILKQPVPQKEPEASNGVDDDNEWLSSAPKKKAKGKKQSVEEPIVSTKIAPPKEVVPKPSKAEKKQAKAAAAAAQATATTTDGWTTIPYTAPNDTKDASNDDDDDTDNPMLSSKDKQALFHQRAFAGDDVAVDFEAEKAAQMEDEDDKIVSTHLPGWGSWAGDGLSKATKRHNDRAAHNPLRKQVVEGVKAANRKDARLKNVVISEAQQRKSKKYLASQLPHQFEKRDQYERSLRIPVGPEWTTKETFQRNTRPRVVVKQGIVEPMEKPLV